MSTDCLVDLSMPQASMPAGSLAQTGKFSPIYIL